ncbi:MAG: hypothetical protein J5I93_12930, partial [Pirellulaceae bacterium]|nr:hypothetical protein [Pirellulaceae bacterium]
MLTMAAVRTMRVWSLAVCAAGLGVAPGWAQSTSVCFPHGDTCHPQSTAVLQQVVVNYAPQTVYRTQWTQVPLTLYRPLTTTDPVTGCTVTCIRPCTTYQLQARRVPHTTLRPVYSTIAVNTAPLPSYHAAPTTSYVLPAAPGFGVPEAGCGVSLQGAVPYDPSPASQPSRPAALPALPADL